MNLLVALVLHVLLENMLSLEIIFAQHAQFSAQHAVAPLVTKFAQNVIRVLSLTDKIVVLVLLQPHSFNVLRLAVVGIYSTKVAAFQAVLL
jgi:hypothetical protein